MAKRSTSDPLVSSASYVQGKRLRDIVARDALSTWKPPAGRAPLAVLQEESVGRIQELLPLRWKRMMADPFAFLRGAASIMASDLAGAPFPPIAVQACGDAHLMNFGVFVSPEASVRFDVDDFDETLPGVSFMMDLCRLAASVAVAARTRGASASEARSKAERTVRNYRCRMRELAGLSPVSIWHSHIDIAEELTAPAHRSVRRTLARLAASRPADIEPMDHLPRLAKGTGRRFHLLDHPPSLFHLQKDSFSVPQPDLLKLVGDCMAQARPEVVHLLSRYDLADVAFKVVGVGSVGTFCAIALLVSEHGEPLVLQVKEASQSVLESFGRWPGRGSIPAGQRVVEGQRVLQGAADPFLGWMTDARTGRHFYVRRLKNHRLGSIAEDLALADLDAYAVLTARTLALAHARSGNAELIAGWLGRSAAVDSAVATFAQRYAALTEQDHTQVKASLGPDGQLPWFAPKGRRGRTARTLATGRQSAASGRRAEAGSARRSTVRPN